MSPLCQSITEKGHAIRVEVYLGPGTDWTLEVVDASNTSTVWDDLFAADQAALDELLRIIREARHELQCSMSAKGNCYDNACAESFFHSLKVEAIHSERFETREAMLK